MDNKNETKNFNIPLKIKNYKIEKELYSLSNSHICLGINLNLKEKVLIKIYEKENFQHNSEEISLINNEIYTMRLINHKNCIKLYEIIETPSHIFLIIEYNSGVILSEFINRKKKLTEDESLNIYKQIVSILIYFHDMKIIHLNINPDDILIDINNNIKLCDFKYCTFYKNNDKFKLEQFGDTNYMCPEFWSEKSCYPELIDIWSSGVLFYFLLVGQLPFKGINNYDLQKKIMGAEFALPLNISKNLQEFFKNIFEPKIESRYDLEKILNSPLFKDKRITKNHLIKGFSILATKYPIDARALEICKTNFDIDIEKLKQKLEENIFDSQTSIYKQIISYFIRKRISTEMDLYSKKYISYITNEKNFFDENTKNNKIQENLKKFEEIKNKYPELKAKLIKKQNDILNKLKTLMEKNNLPKDLPINTEKEKQEKNAKTKIGKTILNKEKDTKNKNDKNNNMGNNNKSIKNLKRGSMFCLNLSSKKRKSKLFDNKLNLTTNVGNKRRMSNAIRSNLRFNSNSLDNHSLKDLNKYKPGNNKSSKYITNNNDIIKESNEEEKKESSESSNISSRNSSKSKHTSKKNEHKKEISKNITTTTNRNNKNIKVNSVPSKNEKPKSEIKKAPQATKEDFFSQLRGVKLKKVTPNTYANPDEIKKKPKDENKKEPPIEYNNNVSVKGVKHMIEENLKKSNKNLNNLSSQPKLNVKTKNNNKQPQIIQESNIKSEKVNSTKKQNKPKITKEQKIKYARQRKSLNYTKLYMFKTRGLIINLEELFNEKSKDDTNKIQLKTNNKKNKNDIIIEEELDEIIIPKPKNLDKNLIDKEKQIALKEKENIITKKKEEEENKIKEEIDKKKEDDEKKKKEEERKIKEELDKKKIEEEKRRQEEERKKKEEEEKKKREEVERKKEIEEKRKQEEERKKKEEEEEEKRRKKEEEIKRKKEEIKRKEEEKKKKEEEEEKRRKEEEEEEKRRKEEEEEKRRKEEEEEEEKRRKEEEEEKRRRRIAERKKREEEELRLKQEEERIRKESEEEERQRKIKEAEEEKRRLEEEELRKKRIEEMERKKREEEEEEEKRRKEEERIRKENEKEKQRLEEERIKKLNEEKAKKEEEEKIKKRKEEQEQNKRLLEEYEKKRKEDEEKKLIRETIKKQKEEELRKKREMELKVFRESNLKKNKKGEIESDSEETNIKIKSKKNNPNNQENIDGSKKNIFDSFNDFFFSETKNKNEKKEKIENKTIKSNFNEKNKSQSQEKIKVFYHYQNKDNNDNQKSYHKSSELLNNKNNKTKIIYQPIQNNFNAYILNKRISEDNLNQNRNSQKSFKKMKIKTQKVIKRNINSNNIHSIKIKNSNTNSFSNEKELMTDIIDSNKIKSNNAFKRINIGKIFQKNFKKIKIIKSISAITKKNHEQDLFNNLTSSDYNYSFASKKSIKSNKNYKNSNINIQDEKNKIANNSVASINSANLKKNKKKYNMTYEAKSKYSKKIRLYTNIPECDINTSNRSNKTIIKIRKNSQQKRKQKCISENELHIYRGDIDYNNVSLKNVQETISNLIAKYQKKGYAIIKKEKSKYNFVKGDTKYLIEIMQLGNGLLYCNISES